MPNEIIVIKRWCWCEACWKRTEQVKIRAGAWVCSCGAHLGPNGYKIIEHKPQEVERVLVASQCLTS